MADQCNANTAVPSLHKDCLVGNASTLRMTQAESDVSLNLSSLRLEEGRSKRKSITKRADVSKYQERRRKEALSKQQQARADRTDKARQLAFHIYDKQVQVFLSHFQRQMHELSLSLQPGTLHSMSLGKKRSISGESEIMHVKGFLSETPCLPQRCHSQGNVLLNKFDMRFVRYFEIWCTSGCRSKSGSPIIKLSLHKSSLYTA